MSEAKHTPAPWVFVVLTGDAPNGDEWETDVEVVGAGKFIHRHDLGYRDDTDTEIKANARLISAAPDLLEALERMQENLGCDDPECAICLCARAAIAKAKGQDT